MRNLIFAINLTLDGCCDHTKGFVDAETLGYFTQLTRGVDLQIFGRKTYQLMVPYWPDVLRDQSGTEAEIEFARAFAGVRKVVFSRTLERAEDENTKIVRTDACEEVLRLKQEQGGDILVGGVDVPTQLMEHGLIDEYRFMMSPIVAGEGRRLFDRVSLRQRLQLKLVDTTVFKSGCVALRYSSGEERG